MASCKIRLTATSCEPSSRVHAYGSRSGHRGAGERITTIISDATNLCDAYGVRSERYLIEGVRSMTEGKGYCARRQERRGLKRLRDLVANKDEVIVVPDDAA